MLEQQRWANRGSHCSRSRASDAVGWGRSISFLQLSRRWAATGNRCRKLFISGERISETGREGKETQKKSVKCETKVRRKHKLKNCFVLIEVKCVIFGDFEKKPWHEVVLFRQLTIPVSSLPVTVVSAYTPTYLVNLLHWGFIRGHKDSPSSRMS